MLNRGMLKALPSRAEREACRDAEKVKSALRKNLPPPVARPVLVVLSGLPGSGKSHFCSKLAERAPFLVVESDALREALFASPTHSPDESARLFAAVHTAVSDYLSRGISIIVDATNLVERNREVLYNIAERQGARLIVVGVEAPEELIRQRLQERGQGLGTAGRSRADWSVYEKIKPTAEKIARRHFVVDTSRDINPVIVKILREIDRS